MNEYDNSEWVLFHSVSFFCSSSSPRSLIRSPADPSIYCSWRPRLVNYLTHAYLRNRSVYARAGKEERFDEKIVSWKSWSVLRGTSFPFLFSSWILNETIDVFSKNKKPVIFIVTALSIFTGGKKKEKLWNQLLTIIKDKIRINNKFFA